MSPKKRARHPRAQPKAETSEVSSRQRVTPQQAVEWALERFGGLRGLGRLVEITEMAERAHRDPAVVSRAIARAFRMGLVEVRAAESPLTRPSRDGDLEEALVRRFEKLRTAIVLKTPVNEAADATGELLHRRLGESLADVAASVFRNGDIIGLGSGRAVFSAVNALGRRLPPPLKTVTLISLTGAVHAQDRREKVLLDADNHVALLGPGLANDFRPQYVSHPLAFDERQLGPARERTPLAAHAWQKCHPMFAIVGVGVLAKGHRLYDAVKAHLDNQMLDPVREPLSKLVDLCDQFSTATYCPVADITNRFFFVPPPAGIELGKDVRRDIATHLERFNDRLLTVTDRQLEQVDTIMLAAGGPQKALAIRELLGRERLQIRCLCTDSDTATKLLKGPATK